MALTRTPRSSWIDEGLRALASGRPDAVRIEPLARALGVTKGGFYWHFHDRNWARRDRKVARRLRRVDNRRMDYMRSLFGAFVPDENDVEARCMLGLLAVDRQPVHRRRSRRARPSRRAEAGDAAA
jgi:AcrR family transcriptional regulator